MGFREITVCVKLLLRTVEDNIYFMPTTYFQSTVISGSNTDSGCCFSFLLEAFFLAEMKD